MNAFGRLFAKGGACAEIVSMCAIKDILVIGFSNGVLILFDVEKLEICFTNKNFVKNDKSIDKLLIFQYENPSKDE
jgi:hypothetical protein